MSKNICRLPKSGKQLFSHKYVAIKITCRLCKLWYMSIMWEKTISVSATFMLLIKISPLAKNRFLSLYRFLSFFVN